jgi:hypothetical protein
MNSHEHLRPVDELTAAAGRHNTGFLVNDVAAAVAALDRVASINDGACTRRVEQRFSIATMVEAYERAYAEIFALPNQPPAARRTR